MNVKFKIETKKPKANDKIKVVRKINTYQLSSSEILNLLFYLVEIPKRFILLISI